jgi:hypothetical protein
LLGQLSDGITTMIVSQAATPPAAATATPPRP